MSRAQHFARPRAVLAAIVSGLLLSASAPNIGAWFVVLVAFVPLFTVTHPRERYRTVAILTYITFFVLHILTTHWVLLSKGTLYLIGGSLFLLLHPALFVLPMLAWHFLRQQWPGPMGMALFPFIWVAFEYVQTLSGLMAPIFFLGNSQSTNLETMQIASIAGVRGVTFWIATANVLVYIVLEILVSRRSQVGGLHIAIASGLAFAVLVVPPFYGYLTLRDGQLRTGQGPQRPIVRVAIVQPNIDPLEKWSTHAHLQIRTLLGLSGGTEARSADLIVWPETAIPAYILLTDSNGLLDTVRVAIDQQQASLLAGFTEWHYFRADEDVPWSSKRDEEGRRYEIYNAAMLLRPGERAIQKYRKTILLPVAERAPFAEALSVLNIDAIRWNFGAGGYGHGFDRTVFHSGTLNGSPFQFGTVICFESLFPEFVREFVAGGAQFLVVITNDSWWGRSLGPYQHATLARLRAVENRRWVIRCANGGVSSIIDPWGRVVRETDLFSRTVLSVSLELHDHVTLYARFGDWLACSCFIVCLGLLGRASFAVFRRTSPGSDLLLAETLDSPHSE